MNNRKLVLYLVALAMLIQLLAGMDIHITRTRFEDNSNRVVITYCEPFGLCQEGER